MQLPNDVQQLIRSTIAVKDDQLIREMNDERSDVAAQLAAKGLVNSSVRVHQDIDAIERFVRRRMMAYVDVYLETLAALGIKIDSELESEIVRHLEGLASAKHRASPPGMGIMNDISMREMYRSRLARADMQALSTGKNRVRMARLRDAIPAPEPIAPAVSHHYTATGPNARVNVDTTDNSTNVINTNAPELLAKIVELSQNNGSPELQRAAAEAKAAYPDKQLTATKIAAWVSLAGSAGHLMHQALPYLNDLYRWLNH